MARAGTTTVDPAGAIRQCEDIAEMLAAAVAELMPQVAERLAQDAQSRAPSIDDEYRELNAEIGQDPLVPRAGDRSGDSDGRVRFIKPESTYLFNAVVADENKFVDEKTAIVGNVEFLENAAQFSYINLDRRGQTSQYTVHNYFQMFEGGKSGMFTVHPHGHQESGRPYPLRPGEGKTGTTMSMVKSITPHRMFMYDYLQTIAQISITSAMAALGPGRTP